MRIHYFMGIPQLIGIFVICLIIKLAVDTYESLTIRQTMIVKMSLKLFFIMFVILFLLCLFIQPSSSTFWYGVLISLIVSIIYSIKKIK
jgi:hypothetical protein